jgi:hypothetical protein
MNKNKIENKETMEYGPTSYNRPVYASPPVGRLGLRFACVNRFAHSHGNPPPHFVGPGCMGEQQPEGLRPALVFATQSPPPKAAKTS